MMQGAMMAEGKGWQEHHALILINIATTTNLHFLNAI